MDVAGTTQPQARRRTPGGVFAGVMDQDNRKIQLALQRAEVS